MVGQRAVIERIAIALEAPRTEATLARELDREAAGVLVDALGQGDVFATGPRERSDRHGSAEGDRLDREGGDEKVEGGFPASLLRPCRRRRAADSR